MVVHHHRIKLETGQYVTVGMEVRLVKTVHELKEVLRQQDKQIVIENPILAKIVDHTFRLAEVSVIGWLLVWCVLGITEKGYKLDAEWKYQKFEGKVTLTPTRPKTPPRDSIAD